MPEVIGLGQLRSDACTYLERVAAGQQIDVVRRGKLVARILPVGDWRVAPIPARAVKVAASNAGGWVGLDELRTRAGRCFDRVAAGVTVYVVRAGRLLARIVSAGESRTAPIPADAGERIELDELRKRAGVISTGSRPGRRLRSSVVAGWLLASCQPPGTTPAGQPDRWRYSSATVSDRNCRRSRGG
jgi:antitoxin (DNA-binding transcriptional repressor) of toxin-antitoxin stability system